MENRLYLELIFLITVGGVQGKPIDISASPSSATVDAGSTTKYTLTVKNNQGSADTVNLFSSGEMIGWASLSKSELTIPAGGSDKVSLSITPLGNAMTGTYKLEVTALASSGEWDSTTVHATVNGVIAAHAISLKAGINPSVYPALEQYVNPGDLRVNLYYTPLLVSEGGYVLKNGDQCCVGDTLKRTYTVGGEWYSDGGPCDTPPILWVDDLAEVSRAIAEGSLGVATYESNVCVSRGRFLHECTIVGNVICEFSCENKNSGNINEISEDKFLVTDEGVIEHNTECTPRCLIYVDDVYSGTYVCWGDYYAGKESQAVMRGGMYPGGVHLLPNNLPRDEAIRRLEDEFDIYCEISELYPANEVFTNSGILLCNRKSMSLGMDFQTPTLSDLVTLNAVKEERKPDLQPTVSTMSENAGVYVVRVNIKNGGDAKALVDDIALNLKSYKIIYKSDELDVGEESDIIVETNLESLLSLTGPVEVTINYRAEKLGCLTTREFTTTFELDACRGLRLHRSSQVYRMDVSGGCVNQYYSCYSPDKGGVLAAGYECFNREPYFIPASQRFDLGFELSSIPPGKDITSATLNLNVGEVNLAQDLIIYSSDNDNWTPTSCEAEKDLCGPTYCTKECSQLFDLGVNRENSVHVGSTGSYSLDVTGFIRSQYLGDKYATLQLRGSKEDLFSIEGESSCSETESWDLKDIRVSSKPYLMVIYN